MWFDHMFSIPIDISSGYGEKTKHRRMLNKFKDDLSFQVNFAKAVEDALNRYKIEGLPETISQRVILQSLLIHGSVVFFKKDGNVFALPGVPTDEYNVNGDPGKAEVFSLNGYFNETVQLYIPGTDVSDFLEAPRTDEEAYGVIVWENKRRFPYLYAVIMYAQAIADTYRTLDVIRTNIKNPQIFYGEESMRSTVERYLELRESNASAGYISTGNLEADKLKMIPFDPKGTSLSDVTGLIEWYEGKLKERNGVKNNSQMDKKGENLIQAEVDITDNSTAKAVDDIVEYLQEQIETVNSFFGLSLKVVAKKAVEEGVQKDDDKKSDSADISRDAGSGKD